MRVYVYKLLRTARIKTSLSKNEMMKKYYPSYRKEDECNNSVNISKPENHLRMR